MEFCEVDYAHGAQCQAHDIQRTFYPRDGVQMIRCGGYVARGVTWQGRTEGTHTLLVCDRHALRFAEQAIAG